MAFLCKWHSGEFGYFSLYVPIHIYSVPPPPPIPLLLVLFTMALDFSPEDIICDAICITHVYCTVTYVYCTVTYAYCTFTVG